MQTNSATQAPVRTAASIAAEIKEIATKALELSGGRNTVPGIVTGTSKSESGTGVIGVEAGQFREIAKTDPVAKAKLDILWLLLSHDLNLSGKTARSNNAVSDYMQERIRVRLEEILEQKVLQDPPHGLDLNRLAFPTIKRDKSGDTVIGPDGHPVMRPPADAVGWARQMLFGSLPPTTRRVFNNERAQLNSFADQPAVSDGTTRTQPSIYRNVDAASMPLSAEDEYLASLDAELEMQDRNELGDHQDAAAVLEQWHEQSRGKRGVDRLMVSAEKINQAFDLPELVSPKTNAIARQMLAEMEDDEDLAVQSLKAFHDLAAGTPTWDQRRVGNEWLALWAHYSPAQCRQLLRMDMRVPVLLVQAAVTLPSKPGRDVVRMARDMVRAASGDPKWAALATRVVADFIAEYYAWFSDYDNRGKTHGDTSTQERQSLDWPQAAAKVLSFPDSPAGEKVRTVEDVAVWLEHFVTTAGAKQES